MFIMNKIYIENKVLILTNQPEHLIEKYPDVAAFLMLDGDQEHNLSIAIKYLKSELHQGVILFCEATTPLIAQLETLYEPITAAGGVVINKSGNILMIYRNKKWDLPKGKVEMDEDIKDAAIREVTEETNIAGLTIIRPIINTYHIYNIYGPENIKTTHWYLMQTEDESTAIPQLEENIELVEWVTPSHIQKYLENTYPNIIDVINESGLI